MTNNKPIFRQVHAHKYSKLGVRRKKKQKYRKPAGRDNKIRLNEAGRRRKVKIGFKNKKSERGLINQLEVVMVYNVDDLKNIKENMIGLIAKVGSQKKKDIFEYVSKHNIKIANVDVQKFLKKIEDKMKKTKEEKKKRDQKKEVRDKKDKEKEVKQKKGEAGSESKDSEELKKEDKLEGKVEEEKEDKASSEKEKEKKVGVKEEKKLTDDEKKVKEAKIKESKK